MRWWRQCSAAVLCVCLMACSGGSNGGGGGGGSTQVTVQVSPGAVLLVANQTQLFTAAVSNVTGVTIATTNGAVRASNVVTITTTAAHNLTAAQLVIISGVTDVSFNGSFLVAAVPSATTFTYGQVGADASSGGGNAANVAVRWQVNDIDGGNSTVGTITSGGLYTAPASLPPASSASITATGVSRATNVVTVTTTAAHNLVVNQVILIAGVTDTSFNGTFIVATVPSATTFTYNQSGANASSGNGTVTSTAVKVKAVSVAVSTASATAIVSIDSGITIQVSPGSATLGTAETLQFQATVNGTTNQTVDWFVDNIAGGNATVGTISTNGLYTAPSTPPNANTATIAANGAVRSLNRVTITTTAAHNFLVNQIVTISGVADASFNGVFTILSVPSTTTFTYVQAAPDATSGGGTAVTAATTVTVKAVSVADSSRSANATVQVINVTDPTLTSINPTTVAQGSVFEDIYITGTGFIATTQVNVNGAALPSSAVAVARDTLLRARIPAALLTAPGTLSIDVQRQGGTPTPSQTLTVVTVRPAVVAASPDSGGQGGPTFDFNVNGGFYGTSTNPTVSAEFNGTPRGASVSGTNIARQATVTIGGADLANAGLFEVGIRSNSDATLFAATNLAVQPSAGPSAPVTVPVGSLPSSVAINTATGIAVVANRGANSLSRIDLATLTPLPGTIAVGPAPTSVAVDEIRNLAVVANNNNGGAGSVSIVDLATATVTSTVTANIANAPFAVGVNSLTGMALVVYANSNHAEIVDLTLTPPAVVATTGISTGGNPHIAVDPRLNWAVVTPGGAGTLSIVDLSRRITATIAAAPGGASRAGGVSTITTTANHTLQVGQTVLISGVADPSFDGVVTITAVPSNTTFNYVQAGAPNAAGSGGGVVTFNPPVAIVAIGANTRGIGINTFTQRAIMADPTSQAVSFFSLLDQLVSGLSLGETGATAAAFNPFTDIAVTVNANLNQASIIDPRTPTRLFTVSIGNGARAVAVDPGTNQALVVNETDGTVSAFQLSTAPIRPLHISQLSLPISRQFAPGITLSSAVDLPVTLLGKGFLAGATVRLDGTSLTPSSVSDRVLTVTVPAAMLARPRRYVVDVVNAGGVPSNVVELTVVQSVDLVGAGGAGCTAPAPVAVAIDDQRELAVVTNSACDNASVVDLTTGSITDTLSVGDNPQGVAISSRLGRAVVSNRSSSNATILDLTASPVSVLSTVTTGSEPLGVTIVENTGQAITANATSGTLSIFDALSGGAVGSLATQARPMAVAVDPVRNIALVAQAGPNNAALVNLNSLSVVGAVGNLQLPTAVVFDPAADQFIVNSSLGNLLAFVNPSTAQATFARSGINPTSIGINYRSSTLVTVNTASSTLSVMDLLERRIRSIVPFPGSSAFSVAVHPRTNLAVIADQANHRLLLFPLPR